MKARVPSIGSSTQTNSASARSSPYSSPMKPWSGKRSETSLRMAASAPLSASVTGSKKPSGPLSTRPFSTRNSGSMASAETAFSSISRASSVSIRAGWRVSAMRHGLDARSACGKRSADLGCPMQGLGQVEQPPARAFAQLVVGADQVERLLARQNLAALGLLGVRVAARPLCQAVVEIAHRNLQRGGNPPEPGGGNAVGAALVLLDLLEAAPDHGGQLLLGQTQQTPAAA